MLSNKEIYRQICERENIPLMAQYRWMEAVSYAKDWDVIIVWIDEHEAHCVENVAAALPFHLLKKYGIRFILMPQLTQFSSIYVNPSIEPAAIISLVVEKLDSYLQKNHVFYCQLQGYYDEKFIDSARRHGYLLSERYSYRIENRPEYNSIITAYNNDRKRNLKRAKGLSLCNIDIEKFYEFHKKCLADRGLIISYRYELLQHINNALTPSSEIEFYGAKNMSGQLLAAAVMISDNNVSYYLLSAYSQPFKHKGAMTWLITQLILIVNGRGQIFDFEGSMVPSIADAYRSYGSTPATYFRIEKYRFLGIKLLMYFWKKVNRIKL